MIVKVKLSEVLDFVKDGKDCKIEIDADSKANVLPIDAAGYDDTIAKQELYASDYEECGSEKDYVDWLEGCYDDFELEANNGELYKITFVK